MLKKKFKTKQEKIGIIGLGYVRLPLAVESAREEIKKQKYSSAI